MGRERIMDILQYLSRKITGENPERNEPRIEPRNEPPRFEPDNLRGMAHRGTDMMFDSRFGAEMRREIEQMNAEFDELRQVFGPVFRDFGRDMQDFGRGMDDLGSVIGR